MDFTLVSVRVDNIEPLKAMVRVLLVVSLGGEKWRFNIDRHMWNLKAVEFFIKKLK